MKEPSAPRRQFTLLQLFAVVAVIAVVLGVSLPVIRGWQERSLRDRCSNKLRVHALGVHTYHDVYNELPPIATDPDHWTWIPLVMRFCESHYDGTETLTQAASVPNNRARAISFRNAWFLCPARRQQATRDAGNYAGGQPTDYVAVSTSAELKWNSQSNGMIVFRRRALTATTQWPPGLSATRFEDVTDGLSNTFMIGEKHMRPEWLGRQYDEPAMVAFEDPNTIRVATDQLDDKGLALRTDDDDPWKFGSWHDGVTLFAFGDASVRSSSNKTDTRTLRLLSCRNDGEPVTVP